MTAISIAPAIVADSGAGPLPLQNSSDLGVGVEVNIQPGEEFSWLSSQSLVEEFIPRLAGIEKTQAVTFVENRRLPYFHGVVVSSAGNLWLVRLARVKKNYSGRIVGIKPTEACGLFNPGELCRVVKDD